MSELGISFSNYLGECHTPYNVINFKNQTKYE